MIKFSKKRFLLLAFFMTTVLFSQAQSSLKAQLCKEWQFKGYEIMGEMQSPPEQKGDNMVFHPDHSLSALASGDQANGKWSLDESTKIITIIPEVSQQATDFKIIEISPNKLVLEVKSEDFGGYPMRIHWTNN
ncbi:MAG: hypothetical protein AAF985_10235 [Bacteroidota bacterium]